jgi:AAA15 family ATPase/GTPase
MINEIPKKIRVKLHDKNWPIPLKSMGDGINRILNLAMALVSTEKGVLLVDEIETGLHYEAQVDMWRLIFKTAQDLDVQVFATTHSWDCIAAFKEALQEPEDQSVAKLFRLDSKYGKLRAVEYDAEDIRIAVDQGIEVR